LSDDAPRVQDQESPAPATTPVDHYQYVKALSHPLRVRILGILEEQPASPVELTNLLDGPTLGTVSYHVRRLNELGLLELVRETPRRGAIEHHYRAKPRPQSQGGHWVAKQAIIEAELIQTTATATRAVAAGGFDSGHARLERHRLTLDAQGVAQMSKAVAKLVRDAKAIQAAATRRISNGAGQTDTALVAMLFEPLGAPDPSAGRPPGQPLQRRRQR
jgi:DNA-binding transcriptional ArsR family regulator